MYDTRLAYPGDLLMCSGRVVKVLKVNQANYRCIDESGGLWNVRIAGATRAPDGSTFTEQKQDEPNLGEPVRFTGAAARKFPGTYIVADKNPSTGRATFVRFNPNRHSTVTDRGVIVKGGFASVERTSI